MNSNLFKTNHYIQDFDSIVLESDAEGKSVVLASTAFFPGEGAQPCDTGQLSFNGKTIQVDQVIKINGKIFHLLQGGLPAPGTMIQGQIDWQRRFNLMRINTALHILSGLIWTLYQGTTTEISMEPVRGRLHFETKKISPGNILKLEKHLNRAIYEARDISVKTMDVENASLIADLISPAINMHTDPPELIKVVEVDGLNVQAGKGLYVMNTAEIGEIKIQNFTQHETNQIDVFLSDNPEDK